MRNHERNRKEIGERIELKLKENHIKKSEVANLLGLNPTAVVNWCNGNNYPSFCNMIDLADLLGVSVGYLADGSEDERVTFSREDVRKMREMYEKKIISEKIYYMWIDEKLEEVAR